jgi:hypothetical protein
MAALMGTLLLTPHQSVAQTLPIIEDPEAYAVYTALFQRRTKGYPEFTRDIRLLQQTRPPTGIHCGQKERPEKGWEPAFADFLQANAGRWLLKVGVDLGLAYTLITPPVIQSILKVVADDPSPKRGGGPEPGLRMLPARYLVVSAVGFNAAKTFALVSDERDCYLLNPADNDVLCSSGDVTPWEKLGGQWLVSPNADSCGWIN